jgi:hemoglobin
MIRRIIPLLALVLLVGCMEGKKDKPLSRTPTLYARLGSEPGITKVVDDFVKNMIASEAIAEKHKEHFRKDSVSVLKRKLIDQVGEATGGPQKYTGKSMKEAHANLGTTKAEFDGTLVALDKALEDNKVGKEDRDEVRKMLESMRPQIVEDR